MRALILAAALATATFAAGAPALAADAAAAAKPAYSTADSSVGDLLDNPQAKTVVDKHLPGFSGNDQIEMAKAMTLRQLQSYAADQFTDEKLNAIDADLAKIPAKK